MNIAIAGGTGLIGTALVQSLTENGHHVFVLTRKDMKKQETNVTYVSWLTPHSNPESELLEIDTFINLAGESIDSRRWTQKQKQQIVNSRVESTRQSIKLLEKLTPKPKTFINASAIGYYGSSLTDTFTELDSPKDGNFLTSVAQIWEKEASKANELGIRTVMLRLGMVLSTREGALKQIILPYKFFAGGTVGTGKQWVSWIHIKDVTNMINYIINNKELKGPVNATAPNPVQMKGLGKTVGTILHRPHWVPAPSFVLRILLGEMSMLVLKGHKVHPEKLTTHGFVFQYPTIESALKNLLYKEDSF